MHSRFYGIVQAGYRKLIERIRHMTEPTSVDVQGPESDGIPERPRTPRTFSRVSSFNKSFSASAEPGDSSENGSPFLNQFTTVGKGYGKSPVYPTSPTKVLTPRPISALAPKSDVGGKEVHWPLQAPSSPTTAKPKPKTLVASIGGENNSPRGDSPEAVDNNMAIALPSSNVSPRGLRSSKRPREDRGAGSKAKEQPASGSTPNKRKKV